MGTPLPVLRLAPTPAAKPGEAIPESDAAWKVDPPA